MSNKKNSMTGMKNIIAAGGVFLLILVLLESYAFVRDIRGVNAVFGSPSDYDCIVSNVVFDSDLSKPVDQPPALTMTSQATISVIGDVMGHMPTVTAAYDSKSKSYNFDNIFPYIAKYISASDYAIANLETTLRGTEGGAKYQGYPTFNTPDTIVDAVKNAGFDMVLTANNHSYDMGSKGMKRTLDVLDKKGVEHTGTFLEETDKRYIVKEVRGIKIGMICYTYETNGSNSNKKYLNGIGMNSESAKMINSFNYEKLDNFYSELNGHIAAMKDDGAEAVMLFIHWGTEYKTSPDKYQKQIAQKVCDLGVDVIVGGHPHVIQPVDLLTSSDSTHKTLCVYSLGNAVSNQRRYRSSLKTGHTEDGCIFSVTFNKYSDGRVVISDTNLMPTWVNLFVDPNTGKNVYRIVPLDKSVTTWGSTFDMKNSAVKDAVQSYDRTVEITGSGLEKAQKYYRATASAILSDSDL